MKKSRSNRRSSRRRLLAARWRFAAGCSLFALALAASLLYVGRRQSRQLAVAVEADLAQAILVPDVPAVPAAVVERPVYPYSIIDGGARTVDELKEAIAKDPVVAAHYAGFDLEKTKVVRLDQPKIAHVSYRLGKAVYWTRKPLVIGAGETVLTDGVHVARTRCGNQLTEKPGEISPAEPAAALLDTPVKAAAASTPSLSSRPQPVAGNSSTPSISPSGGTGGIGSSGTMNTGGSSPSPPTGAAGAVGSGFQADEPPNPVPASDDLVGGAADSPGHPDGPSNFPAPPGGVPAPPGGLPTPPGGSKPPFDGPPTTLGPPTWSLPPETLLPPGNPDLAPGPLDPGNPGQPPTPDEPQATPIPEPGTAILMLGGAVAYAARRIRGKP
jgi:hypothetical protein